MRRSLNFKVIILLILIVFIGLGWSIKAAKNNLHQYAYYYASHMERRKHDYPVINMMNYKKIDKTMLPGYIVKSDYQDRKTESYRYEIVKENVIRRGDIVSIPEYSNGIYYYENDDSYRKDNYHDGWDLVADNSWTNVDAFRKYPTKEQMVLYQVLDDIESQIKQNSPKPTVNLQWLFDRIYPIWWGY